MMWNVLIESPLSHRVIPPLITVYLRFIFRKKKSAKFAKYKKSTTLAVSKNEFSFCSWHVNYIIVN